MSAWIRSVTGRAYHFESLNAKQLQRPHCEVHLAGGKTGRGFDSLSPNGEMSELQNRKISQAARNGVC